MIHWNFIVYIIVALPLLIIMIVDYIKVINGGNWGHGKKAYSFGLYSFISIVAWIVWTLIWGGVFWW